MQNVLFVPETNESLVCQLLAWTSKVDDKMKQINSLNLPKKGGENVAKS